ncbi:MULTISPECIES: flippase [Paraburkholderia]|uniref:Flippase n=1 Tax=Paraburkholderia madseniana TaxID=2599607 RepID=A0AAP5BKD9_9BURK|nr:MULTISPECIES: flippase [Paraburkholderia]MCX4149871.1 flippase [Paraburkholderia madseniana]MDN7152807.1 flippase [Paraburkholderia sp. WS6]MDQ6411689.1 flippase [Paraburkholderia madseniana]
MLALSVLQVANMVLPLATLPYLFRVLGPNHFGAYVFAQAVVTYLVLLADYGFNWSATGEIARVQNDRDAVSRIFWKTQVAKTLVACVGLALLVLGVLLVPKFIEIRPIIFATFPLVIGTVLFPQWLFQGLERMSFVTISTLSARLLVIPATYLLVHSPDDTWRAALIASMSTVVAGLISLTLIARMRLISFWLPGVSDVIGAFRDGWHVFMATAAISLYTTTNSVLLGFLAGNVTLGYFGAADKIRNVAQSLIAPLSNAMYPRVNALFAEDTVKAYALVRKALYAMSTIMFAVSVMLWALAPWIVRIGMGPQYAPVVDVLRWMAFVPWMVALNNVLGLQMMLPLGMKKKFSEILLGSGVFNIALLVPLSIRFGAQGAAMSILATEALVTGCMALYLVKKRVPIFLARASTD